MDDHNTTNIHINTNHQSQILLAQLDQVLQQTLPHPSAPYMPSNNNNSQPNPNAFCKCGLRCPISQCCRKQYNELQQILNPHQPLMSRSFTVSTTGCRSPQPTSPSTLQKRGRPSSSSSSSSPSPSPHNTDIWMPLSLDIFNHSDDLVANAHATPHNADFQQAASANHRISSVMSPSACSTDAAMSTTSPLPPTSNALFSDQHTAVERASLHLLPCRPHFSFTEDDLMDI